MDKCFLLVFASTVMTSSAWSLPYYPVSRAPIRVVRYAVPPHQQHHAPPSATHYRIPVHEVHEHVYETIPEHDTPQWQRPKRGQEGIPEHDTHHRQYPKRGHETVTEHDAPQWQRPKRGHDYDSDHRGSSGVTGPIHTFVKTDKNANYKWGVRHHVGDKFSS